MGRARALVTVLILLRLLSVGGSAILTPNVNYEAGPLTGRPPLLQILGSLHLVAMTHPLLTNMLLLPRRRSRLTSASLSRHIELLGMVLILARKLPLTMNRLSRRVPFMPETTDILLRLQATPTRLPGSMSLLLLIPKTPGDIVRRISSLLLPSELSCPVRKPSLLRDGELNSSKGSVGTVLYLQTENLRQALGSATSVCRKVLWTLRLLVGSRRLVQS